jgi:hypothetical protein
MPVRENNMKYYDLIGDIHGHADELIKLLLHLGYEETADGYRHESHQVIFLGDFIDRGAHLAQHTKLLHIVMQMVDSGAALAVMGNHEFNALTYHTEHNGLFLRPHTKKNTDQHQAFLNEYEHDASSKQRVLDFFYSLPVWLELEGLRVVHACWDAHHIDAFRQISPSAKLDPALLIEAATKGTAAYDAIERLLKGVEVELPAGVTFADKDKHPRSAVRVQWWKQDAIHLGDVALPLDLNIGDAADLPLASLPESIPFYSEDQRPCFIGHYWLDGTPAPLTSNVACLDYSVAKEGKLVAYRWRGEQTLKKANFTHP